MGTAGNTSESVISSRTRTASMSTDLSPATKFEIRIPLSVILLGWTIIFAGGLSLSIGLIQAQATSSSIASMSVQLRQSAMDEATAEVTSSLASMEATLLATSDDYEFLSFVNSDSGIASTGLTTLSLFSPNSRQLAGKFMSACASIRVCHVVGVWIADNAVLSYTNGQPSYFTVQDPSTIAAGNYSNKYTISLDNNDMAAFNATTFLSKSVITTFNSSTAFANLGLSQYPTSLFWASNITGSTNFGYNNTVLSYDLHILLMRAMYYNMPFGRTNGQHYQAVARASMSISTMEASMQGLNSTTNGVVFVIDTTWYMVSASVLNISAVNYGKNRWLCTSNPNTLVADSCTYLYNTYFGNANSIPLNDSEISFTSSTSGTVLLNVGWIHRTNLNWLVISAIPRSDIYANIDLATTHVTISAVIMAVVGLILSSSLAIAVTRPLRTLQRMMNEARSLRFHEIREKNYLNKRSILAELASMEDTFHHMLKKLAEAIQANKSLMPLKVPSGNHRPSMSASCTQSTGALGSHTTVSGSLVQINGGLQVPNSDPRRPSKDSALDAIHESE